MRRPHRASTCIRRPPGDHDHVSTMRFYLCAGILISAVVLRADSSDPAVRFLAVEGSAWSTAMRQPEQVALDELPPGLGPVLAGYETGYPDGMPASLCVFRRDLNGDGRPEYFVQTNNGGSGGRHYLICATLAGKWRVVASLLGTIHELAHRDAWAGLVAVSRGGGGHYAKTHLVLRDDAYEVASIERYDNGRISRETP